MAIVLKIPDDEYHSKTDHLSSSMLKKMAVSPSHCKAMMDGQESEDDGDKEDSKALTFGRAVHSFLLEDESHFKSIFRVKKYPWNIKAGIAEKAEFERNGWTPVDGKQMEAIIGIKTSFDRHPIVQILMSSTNMQTETSILWDHNALPCRCKPDAMGTHAEFGPWILDVKTCQSCLPHKFSADTFKYGYDIQDVHYSRGYHAAFGSVPTFYFFAVESKPPYACMLYQYDPEVRNHANNEWNRLVSDFVACQEAGIWPGMPENINLISLPRWKKGEQNV